MISEGNYPMKHTFSASTPGKFKFAKVSFIAKLALHVFVATLFGVLAPLGVFIRGEWHLRAPTRASKYPSEGYHIPKQY